MGGVSRKFICLICDTTVTARMDVLEGYCPNCHAYTLNCAVTVCDEAPAKVLGNVAACQSHYDEIIKGARRQ